jgi:hypothetical protein
MYKELISTLIELMKENTSFQEIKQYDTNYFDDKKQTVFPVCSIVATSKQLLKRQELDGKCWYAINFKIIYYTKGAKAQIDKAYSFDEAFTQLINQNYTIKGLATDSEVQSSQIDVNVSGNQIITTCEITLTVTVVV